MKDLVKTFRHRQDGEEIRSRIASRSSQMGPDLIQSVAQVVEDVRKRGDQAVLDATRKWDSVELASIDVHPADIQAAKAGLSPRLVWALRKARSRIERLNRRLIAKSPIWMQEIEPGIAVGEKSGPISSAGLWVPCRKGPLASTMLMLAVPASVAGVGEIVAATPPLEDGSVDPTTLAAAEISGVSRVVRGNGVALIAAMAFGTESVPQVDAIYGPGPPAINAAMGYVGIYGVRTGPPMGPSECMVIADESSDPAQVAADLLNECEHGPDSSAVLVTDSTALAEKVSREIAIAAGDLGEPRRSYVEEALSQRGMIVLVSSKREAAEFVNSYAPEHLQIALAKGESRRVLRKIRNAGEILLGQSTPFSAANYAMGITAVLPTGGSARAFSGLTARDFMKASSIGSLDRSALGDVCQIVSLLGEAEGLPAHVRACTGKLGLAPTKGKAVRGKR